MFILDYWIIILRFPRQVLDANDRNRFEHRRQIFECAWGWISVGFGSAQPSARRRLLRNWSTTLFGEAPRRQTVPSAFPGKRRTVPSTVSGKRWTVPGKRRTVSSTVPWKRWTIPSAAIPPQWAPSRFSRWRLPAAELRRAGSEFHIGTRRPEVRAQTAVRGVVRHQARL